MLDRALAHLPKSAVARIADVELIAVARATCDDGYPVRGCKLCDSVWWADAAEPPPGLRNEPWHDIDCPVPALEAKLGKAFS